MVTVNLENYEEYIMLHIDGELNEKEETALFEFLKLHPDKQEELKVYESVKLIPDMQQVFVGKEQLLKKEKTKVIVFRNWWLYSAAACVIAIIFLMNYQRWMDSSNKIQTNNNDVAYQQTSKSIQESKVENIDSNKLNIVKAPEKTNQPNKHTAYINSHKKLIEKSAIHLAKSEIHPIRTIKNVTLLPEENTTPLIIENIVAANNYQYKETLNHHESFLEQLPISQEKKEGLFSLKESVVNRIEQFKKIKNNLKDTEIALKLGDNQFVINL